MDKQLDPVDLDAAVLRELSAVRSFGPRGAFADQVMARVRLPRPAALVLLSRAGTWLLQPARAVALATAYAASVAIALRLALPWIAAHSASINLATGWVGAQITSGLDAAALAAAGLAMRLGVADALRSAAGAGPRLWAAIGALSLGYAMCGYGLHVLLKSPRRDDVLARAR